MKNAKEILQFSGYPLEPIVALQIKKTYDAKVKETAHPLSPYVRLLGSTGASQQQQWDSAWYGNYE